MRMILVALLVPLLVLSSAGHTSGTIVTSCEACHEQAVCRTSPMAGDITCTCKKGFSGDGLICLPGHTATDDHPAPRRVRRSYPTSNTNLAHVRFSCGFYECADGEDCITVNGIQQCANPCKIYTVLNNAWRSTNNNVGEKHCDRNVHWDGYYRMFISNQSVSMPDKCVDSFMCGTQAPLWLAFPPPQQVDEIVQSAVCASFNGDCCWVQSQPIHVKACPGNYFVYKFVMPPGCYFAYCAYVSAPTTTPKPVTTTTTTTTTKAPVKVTTTTKAPVKITTTTQTPVKVTKTTNAPVKDTTTTQTPVTIPTTTETPAKITTTPQTPVKITTIMQTPVKITMTTQTSVNITTTTKSPVDKNRTTTTTQSQVATTMPKAMCGTCRAGETCVSTDGVTWRCERPDQPVLLRPELVCGRSLVQVGLNRTNLEVAGLDATTANLADPRCNAHEEHDGMVWYQVERTEGTCGNTLETNGTDAIFSNSLFIYHIHNVSFSRPVSVPFSCAYPLESETSLDVAIKPYLSLKDVQVGKGSKVGSNMTLYHSDNFTKAYPAGGVTLPVGSVLHVGVSVEESETERFVVVLEDCYATQSPDPKDIMRYYIIQNKCPTEFRQVRVEESGSSLRARFSALLFLYQGDYRDVFLHCRLSLCDQRSSSCTPVCSKRKYRSVTPSVPLEPLTIGPITWSQNEV
ncbi:pancreatic secretory granule membrane major glycoprotein GP2-like [Salmo trutta]|uniref:pancreatic secretory granule membrane major glycoprotein GP2-like n=1 Tax=Salmo trutta TaxID=8032 RepID=UPI001130AF39|nr:pancreatic secretory granule membrane major glycoprotein GP2-like [Salmo trutta]